MNASTRNQWLEWVSQNLALGVSKGKLRDEMMQGGLSKQDSSSVIEQVLASPLHAATVRVGRDLLKWMSLSDALLDLEALGSDPTRIPRVSNLSSEEFLKSYYALNRPVIIEDVAAKWPALSKWNLDFLRKNFGAARITYQGGRSSDDHRDSFVDHSKDAFFSEYLDLIESNKSTNQYYLIAHDHLLDRTEFRCLLDDIVFDQRYFDSSEAHGRVFFWLGPEGSTTPLHRDLGNVYFVQILGRKTVKMIPSKQMHKVYNELGYHSEVDLENWSSEAFPLLKNAHIAEVTIHPGEMLFIPLGWWHHVKALEVSITITGNNFRFRNAFTSIF